MNLEKTREMLPPPERDLDLKINLGIRLPSGEREIYSFSRHRPLADIFLFAQLFLATSNDTEYQLVAVYPRRSWSFTESGSVTIQDAQLSEGETIYMQELWTHEIIDFISNELIII